ncbi:MAG: hypothetical protein QNJ51_09760 [Calothrix sp. MO_167.B12]|nr:hypothetical protein [Calothrix sp. MO_167.B12]
MSFLGSSQSGELFRIDLSTGSAELIGNMGSSLATEIEFDVQNDTLYAEEVNGGTGLHTIDPTTGASLGEVNHPFGALNGLEFVGSTLYGTFITFGGGVAPSNLVIVDTSNGNLTTVGATGLGPITGLSVDPVTGIFYGVTAGVGFSNESQLVTIDLSTGQAEVIGGTGFNRVGSIEFAADGNLYGGISQNGSRNPNHLIQIDVTTGESTLIGNTGFSITGLTLTEEIPAPTNLIEGTEGSDGLNGTSNSEVIRGLGGNDNINGNGGRDTLVGGGGNDNINGASGDELILGGFGNDYINANGGNDRILTGAGNDTITTGSGNDFIHTGSGLDLVQLNGGNDIVVLLPGEGYDTIRNFQLGSISNPRTQFKAGNPANLSFEDFGNGVNISLGSDLLAFVDNVRASTLNANLDAIFI